MVVDMLNKIYNEISEMFKECENDIANSHDEFGSSLIMRFQLNAFNLIGKSAISHKDKLLLGDIVCQNVLKLVEYSRSFR